jgi:hypothetical protein
MLMHEFDRGEGGWREEHRHIPPGSNGKCQNIHTRNITKDVTDYQENLRDTMLDDCIDKNGEHHVNKDSECCNTTPMNAELDLGKTMIAETQRHRMQTPRKEPTSMHHSPYLQLSNNHTYPPLRPRNL